MSSEIRKRQTAFRCLLIEVVLLVSGKVPLVRHAGRNGLFVCHAAAIMAVLFSIRSHDDSSVRHADVKVHGKPLRPFGPPPLRGGGVFLAVNIPAGA